MINPEKYFKWTKLIFIFNEASHCIFESTLCEYKNYDSQYLKVNNLNPKFYNIKTNKKFLYKRYRFNNSEESRHFSSTWTMVNRLITGKITSFGLWLLIINFLLSFIEQKIHDLTKCVVIDLFVRVHLIRFLLFKKLSTSAPIEFEWGVREQWVKYTKLVISLARSLLMVPRWSNCETLWSYDVWPENVRRTRILFLARFSLLGIMNIRPGWGLDDENPWPSLYFKF